MDLIQLSIIEAGQNKDYEELEKIIAKTSAKKVGPSFYPLSWYLNQFLYYISS